MKDPYAVLRIRDFRLLMGSKFFITLAGQMQAVVVGWQVYQMTHDPLSLGLIGLAEAVSFIGFALWAGKAADSREKKRIIRTAQASLLVASMILLGLTGVRNTHTGWIYAVMAFTGLARSYLWSAETAFLQQTVPTEIFSRAAAWNSSAWEIGAILGPALGGALYAWSGPLTAYGSIVFCLIVALGFSHWLPRRFPQGLKPGETLQAGLLSGIRFVFSQKVILAALTLDMFAVLFGGVVAILPVFAEMLRVGPGGLGLMRAAPAAGAIGMALYQTSRPPYKKTGQTLLTTVTIFGLCIIGFSLSKSFILSLVLLAAGGMADNISVVIRASIVQALTPESMRGRVSAVNGIFIGSSNEIGAFESGAAAKLMGAVPSVIFGGIMTLVTVVWVTAAFPELRRLGYLAKER